MRAGDADLPFSARNTEPLLALGAFEIAVRFSVREAHARIAELDRNGSPPPQKLLILRIPSLDVARKDTEIAQDQQREDEHTHPVPASDPFNQNQRHAQQKQRIVKLIASIAPSHKTAEEIHCSEPSFPIYP